MKKETNKELKDGFKYSIINKDNSKAVFLLHGIGDSKSSFESIINLLADFKIISFDLAGFGNNNNFNISFDSQINLIKELVLEEGGAVNHFIGHSFGGLLLLQVLSEYPELKRDIVLTIEPSITKVDFDFFKFIQEEPLGIGYEGLIRGVDINEYSYARKFKENLLKSNSKVFKDYAKYVYENFDHLFDKIVKSGIGFIYIFGKSSNLPSERRKMIKYAEKIYEVENAQHWVHIDNPNEFQRIIKEELKTTANNA